VALAMHGVFPMDELSTIKRLGTRLQGHPDINKTPGVEAPTGSLGQGLSFANGMALGGRLDGLQFSIYLILGDGELQEGQVWEAAMTSSHYKLGNICVVVDKNGYQSQGSVDRLMGVDPIEERFQAFGWKTLRIRGHEIEEICAALDTFDGKGEKPLAIVAKTVKGKGVSFMEHTHQFHNAPLTREQYDQAMKELSDE